MKKGVSLYIHVPFCAKRCNYCDFIIFTNANKELIDNYISKICQEILYYKQFNEKLNTIFWGGGTPSFLKIEHLEKVINTIQESFNCSNIIEHTIEINPVNLNRKNLEKYRNLGINRLSIGIQSFNQDILNKINRNHSVENIYKTFNSARKAGFNNISFDLIFGLPEQTISIWEDTLNKAISLSPEHISIYSLDLHENTILYEKVQNNQVKLPNDEDYLEMFYLTQKLLSSNDYSNYEISNWAKKGFESKHNKVYWKNYEYIGIGVSATSFYKNRRYKNTNDLQEYLSKNNFEIKENRQTLKEELEETIFMNLRLLNEGLNIKQINRRFNIDFLEKYKKQINELLNKNFIILSKNKLRINKKYIPISNEIFM
ncbi:MAG: radical SAM family heme chaperone HemW, partial [Candidatus Woesearchaeota archaeon]